MRTNQNRSGRFMGILFCLMLCLLFTVFSGAQAQAKASEQDELLQSVLMQIEEQYAQGVTPPGRIDVQQYLSGIAPIVFVTGKTIPHECFALSGLPEGTTLPDDWEFTADGQPFYGINDDGTTWIDAQRFPDYPGYHIVNVTVNNVPATQLGVLELSGMVGETGEKYYYLTPSVKDEGTKPDRISATVLNDGEFFTINYAINEFEIMYDVHMESGAALPEDITLDSVFGVGRPLVTSSRAYSFDVRIPYGYTARVYRYWMENGTEKHVELTGKHEGDGLPVHNDGFPLGAEPVYTEQGGNIQPDASLGPSSLLVSDTFYDNSVTENRRVVVELTKSEPPVFNATLWTHTENAGGSDLSKSRGSSAGEDFVWEEWFDDGHLTDIKSEDGKYNWGTYFSATKEMKEEDDGTYSYTWTFQTNNGAGDRGYLLDALEINGVDLVLPFNPKVIGTGEGSLIGDNPDKADPDNYYTVATLPDGAKVKLEYLSAFKGGNPCNQRIYRVTVTGARTNVTITGGNLMQYGTGAAEFITYELTGVHADNPNPPGNRPAQMPAIQAYTADGWKDTEMSKPVVSFPYVGDDTHYNANIRFKLVDGYGDPAYSFESRTDGVIGGQKADTVLPLSQAGSPMDSRYIYGPDDDGWYYIYLTGQGGYKMALLTIAATPTKYVARYLQGDVESTVPDTMPKFEHSDPSWAQIPYGEQYDDNGGAYYDVLNSSVITVDGRTPVDVEQQSSTTGKIFSHWTLVDEALKVIDESIVINPGQPLLLNGKYPAGGKGLWEYAILNSSLSVAGVNVRVLRLQAVWKPTPDPFKYTIWIEYLGEDGEWHREEAPADVVTTENDYNSGSTRDKLSVAVNFDAPAFSDWLKQHPYYHFDPNQQDVQVVEDDGDIIVRFVPNNGGLILSKVVSGGGEPGEVFTFTIEGPGVLNGNYLAWPADIPLDERKDEDMITVHFTDGKADIELKDGESIILYIPAGTYTVTETGIKDSDEFDYTVIADGKVSRSGTRQVELAKTAPELVFINTRTGKAETAINGESAEVTVRKDGTIVGPVVLAGDVITYQISWINYTLETAKVTVTDPLDPGVEYVESDPAGSYDAAAHTVTWDLGERAPGASGTVILKVRVAAKAAGNTVSNRASTQVAGHPPLETNSVINPADGTPSVPKTGDDSHPGAWLALMLMAMTGLGACALQMKKKAA